MSGACRSAETRPVRQKSVFGLANVVARFALWRDKRRSRLDLLDLTDEQLRDVGISRSQAQREGLRPFWD
nr:DUF1127 domain-containing protein [uncultured Nitratireductor sp.]